MKITIVNTLYPPNVVGGAERSVELLAQGLVGMGHRVTIVSISPGEPSGPVERDGVTAWYLGLSNIYWPWSGKAEPIWRKLAWHGIDTLNRTMAAKLRAILAADPPDILHTNNLAGFSVLAWQVADQLGIPVVHTLRDYYLVCVRSTMFRKGRRCQSQCADCKLFARPRRRFSAIPRGVAAVGQFLLYRHLGFGYFPNARIRQAIINPIKVPEATAPRPHLPGSPMRFGFMGQIQPEKGLEHLIDGFLSLGRPDWRLDIAGKGDEALTEALKRRAAGSDQIRFVGFVPAAEFLDGIDVAMVSSVWDEPLPRSILEASAAGKPVIATARGGNPEVVEEGVTGHLYDPDQKGQLAAFIRRMLEDPAQAAIMGAAARARLGDRSAGQVAADYDAFYRAALE